MNKSHSLWFICFGLLALGFGMTTTVKADTISFVAATPVINGTTSQQGPFLNFTVGGNTAQTPLGVFTFAGQGVVDFRVPNADGSFPGTGTVSYTLPAGDKLLATILQSFFPPDANGISQFTALTTITGGTGIFAGATGTIKAVGSFNNITGIGQELSTYSITAPGLTAPVPEPATLLLLGTGLTGWALRIKRRKEKQHSLK